MQNTKDYLLEIKESFELGEIQQTVNPNFTFTLTMANTGLADDLNTKQIFVFNNTDYDEVEVTVNPYKLGSLVPNPATSQVTVNYIADEATSAYLMVTNTSNGIFNNYILDTTEFHTTLDISSYPSGLYSVALVCNGQIQQSKTLAKQ